MARVFEIEMRSIALIINGYMSCVAFLAMDICGSWGPFAENFRETI